MTLPREGGNPPLPREGFMLETWDEDALSRLIDRQMDSLFVPIAPGVEGLVKDEPSGITIAGIRAIEPGTGAVAAYLDALPRDREVCVPYVTSERLEGMLERRGFRRVTRFDATISVWGPWWVRKGSPEKDGASEITGIARRGKA